MSTADYARVLRTSAEKLAQNLEWIRCNEDALVPYTKVIAARSEQQPFDSGLFEVGDELTRAGFVILRDAINFGSGYHPHLTKRDGMSGSRTITWHLADYIRMEGLPPAGALTDMTPQRCASMFHQAQTGPAYRLMEMFSYAWRELGIFLERRYDGRIESLLEAAKGSATALVSILTSMDCWRDVAEYRGRVFPFFKRAQLAAYGVTLAAPNLGAAQFSDLGELTIFADNLIPHVLKMDGVLTFADNLNSRIDRGELIAALSPEEIEIRAAAVHACERLVTLCAAAGHRIKPLELASFLWKRGQGMFYKSRPRHRTCTFAY